MIVGPLLLLLLSLEEDEVKCWMDGVNWVGLGWVGGEDKSSFTRMCVCVFFTYLNSQIIPEESFPVLDYRYLPT